MDFIFSLIPNNQLHGILICNRSLFLFEEIACIAPPTSFHCLPDKAYNPPETILPLNMTAFLSETLAIASAEHEASMKTKFASSPIIGH